MGQGGACNRCSDVSLNKNAPKALDDTDSEEEPEESEGSSEEENHAEKKDEEDKEVKRGAELALQDGLKRGKTSTFTEAIEHSRAVGLDEEKIQLAEKKLEDHKNFRRREAFEADLYDFLRSEESLDLQSCQDKLVQGKEYGLGEKPLKSLQDHMLELETKRELNPDEVQQAKQFLELCTRRFVASCLMKGRDVHWIDLETGSKHKVVLKMDVVLKNFSVTGPPNGDLTCKVDEITTKRAIDAAEVSAKSGFSKLGDTERSTTVAVLLPSGKGPWCFLEGSPAKQDEFIIAFQVFNGFGAVAKTSLGGKDNKVPAIQAAAASPGDEDEAAERQISAVDTLPGGTEGGDISPKEETGNPISPRGGKKSPKGAKRKSKTEEPKEEKPPPLPPPIEEEEEAVEAEAEEEEEE